ncbi:MAG TPA: pilus assembly protein TadG-related protein [Thermohalobaculum sp.]|nr:pilus assembly protein TadG-related protein [Thermohalobaculum sp.]
MGHRRSPTPPCRRAAGFAANDRGAAAIVLAVALPVMIGGMALGTEVGSWFMGQRELQQAADLAAHAAGVKLREGADEATMRDAALDVASASGFDGGTDTLTLLNPPDTGAFAGDADSVAVRLLRDQPRYFTRIYSSEPVDLNARAVVAVQGGATACLLALSTSASGAVTISGSTEVTFEGCDVASNSSASDSFLMSGGGSMLSTGCVNTVGGAQTTAGLTMTDCTSVNANAPPAADPYADVAEPELTGTCQPSGSVKDKTLTPTENHPSGVPAMRFCSGLDVRGSVTFDPGLYLIEGGSFTINSNALVVGSGVTFYLGDGVEMKFNGSAQFSFSAPTSGPFSGLLIFGSRSATTAQHTVTGNAASTLDGAIYTPASHLDFTGDFTDDSGGCVQVVTSTVQFSGNSSLQVDCAATGTRTVAVREEVRLVE